MLSRIKIFRLWSEEGFLSPVFDDSTGLPHMQVMESISVGEPAHPWEPWRLTWHREKKNDALPDFSGYPRPASCEEGVARRFWPDITRDFDLLPMFVDGTPWRLICSTKVLGEIDLKSSDIDWSEEEVDGQNVHKVSYIRWANVVNSNADGIDAFKLSIQPKVWVYFTERFVDRYHALGLKGVYFEHVGYIVDKPENAVPPPPRPVPQLQQAPRWPKWEAAPDEEVARFTQAGQAFLQARGLSESAEASAILNALAADIEAHRPGYAKLKPKARIEVLEGLAGAFGLLLRQQLQWNWVDLQVTSRAWDLGLESPNGSHALCLNQVMVRQLTSREPSTITLLFNMISVGNLPPGDPGDHVAIG